MAELSAPVANCIDLPNYDHYETVISSVLSRGREGQISEPGRGDNAARHRPDRLGVSFWPSRAEKQAVLNAGLMTVTCPHQHNKSQ